MTKDPINVEWLPNNGHGPYHAGVVSIGNPKLEQWAGWEFQDYTMGLDKPHYPVPALRIEVEIQYDRVILWQKYGNMWGVEYLAIGW